MASICSAVFPCPKMTSGNPHRSRRCEVDLGEPAGVLERMHADPVQDVVRPAPSFLHVPEQFPELMRVHRSNLECQRTDSRDSGSSSTSDHSLVSAIVPIRNRFELSCASRPSVVCSS